MAQVQIGHIINQLIVLLSNTDILKFLDPAAAARLDDADICDENFPRSAAAKSMNARLGVGTPGLPIMALKLFVYACA